jgi:hypothetical protein
MTQFICTNCGYEGKRKGIKPGSTTMEVLIWVTLFFPGPLYTLWRILGKRMVCPQCNEATMVKTNSPLGKRKQKMIIDELSPTPTQKETNPEEW